MPTSSEGSVQAGKMLGICIEDSGEGRVSLQSFAIPEVTPGTARVRVELAGICATDMALLAGYKDSPKNMVLGHEFCGVIDDIQCPVGSETHLKRGDRVVSEINCVTSGGCGDWRQRAQEPSRVALGIFGANGCFAQFVLCPVENLHKIPDSIANEDAVFVEPLAAACSVLEEAHLRPSDSVAVLGGGKLGTLVAAALRASNFAHVQLLVSDRVAANRSAEGELIPHPIQDVSPFHVEVGAGADAKANAFQAVVECTGSPAGLHRALQLVRPRGTVVLKSTYPTGDSRLSAVDMSLIVVKEITIQGSRCGYFPSALQLIRDKSVIPQSLIEEVYNIKDAGCAFVHARRPGSLKVLIDPCSISP